MRASIISIGDELLFGQTLDTNAHWISQQLTESGIDVFQRFTIHDQPEEIKRKLDLARADTNLIILTGGLGPTLDDKTKETIAEYFKVDLVLNQKVLQQIEKIFAGRNIGKLERNKQQAMLPSNCEAIPNLLGTAPGMWFELDNQLYISMPGVPIEMKSMMTEFVMPKLKRQCKLPALAHHYLMTAAIGESQIAELLQDFEKKLPAHIALAYLPGQAVVKLRLTARGDNQKTLTDALIPYAERIKSILGNMIYSEHPDEQLQHILLRLLGEAKLSLATAESCTGGTIAKKITSVAGSSKIFKGSVIAYANEVKKTILGVPDSILQDCGAVNEETVLAMARGVLQQMNADLAIAVSGIAGPGGGNERKPVGTVWIALASQKNVHTRLLNLPGNRQQIIEWSSVIAMEMLRRFFIKHFA